MPAVINNAPKSNLKAIMRLKSHREKRYGVEDIQTVGIVLVQQVGAIRTGSETVFAPGV